MAELRKTGDHDYGRVFVAGCQDGTSANVTLAASRIIIPTLYINTDGSFTASLLSLSNHNPLHRNSDTVVKPERLDRIIMIHNAEQEK